MLLFFSPFHGRPRPAPLPHQPDRAPLGPQAAEIHTIMVRKLKVEVFHVVSINANFSINANGLSKNDELAIISRIIHISSFFFIIYSLLHPPCYIMAYFHSLIIRIHEFG